MKSSPILALVLLLGLAACNTATDAASTPTGTTQTAQGNVWQRCMLQGEMTACGEIWQTLH